MSDAAIIPTAADSAAPESGETGQSFWDLVWYQYRKRKEAYIGLFLLGGLFLLALAAPLFANNLPWMVTGPNGTSFPLIRDFIFPLLVLDRFYNCALLSLLVLALVAGPARLLLRSTFGTLRFKHYVNGLALTFVLLFTLVSLSEINFVRKLFGNFIGARNDITDYKALKASNSGTTVIMTLVPYGSLEDAKERQDQPPDKDHPLGCDNNGFDVLARIIHGARISMAVGFLAIGLAVLIGVVVGSLAGYYVGWVDLLVSRVIEVFICFPSFFLILTIIAIAPQRSIFWVMFAIGFTGWMGVARLIRGEVLKIRALDYVQAARAMGMNNARIVFRHILPNALAPVLVAATFGVAGAILAETGLGFLGLGVEPPTPSWGELLNQARADPVRLWWLTIYPGFMIFLSVTLMNLVGEGLRDAMDPKMRR